MQSMKYFAWQKQQTIWEMKQRLVIFDFKLLFWNNEACKKLKVLSYVFLLLQKYLDQKAKELDTW